MYHFGIVDGLRADLKKMVRRARNLVILGNIHHQKDDVNRLYMKMYEGGSCLDIQRIKRNEDEVFGRRYKEKNQSSGK